MARPRRFAAAVKPPASTTASSTRRWSILGVARLRISKFLKRSFDIIQIFLKRRIPIYGRTGAFGGRIMLKVGMIVGSTRPNRFADTPVQWMVEGASARRDLQLAVLDLRDHRLPFFNEPASPA